MVLPLNASEPPKVTAVAVPEAVAAAEIVTSEPPETDVTIAPVGMPVPLTGCPTAMPAVVPTVIVLLPETVVEVAGVANVRLIAGAAVPPVFAMARLPSVLLPHSERVALPLSVTADVLLIWPGDVNSAVAPP